MKQIIITIFIFTLFSSHPINAETKLPAHLKYFGYALVDCGWDDPHDRIKKTNYVDEVSGFTNMAQLCIYSPNDQIESRLTNMKAKGIKAVLSVQSIFFTENGKTASGTINFDLLSDYETRWNNFLKLNKKKINADFIQTLYIADEPYWRGITYDDLKKVSLLIKKTNPKIPISFIEAYVAIPQMKIPPSVDWIGFDQYDIYDPSSDSVYLKELQTLKAKRTSPHQKIIIVFDAQWRKHYGDLGVQPKDMGEVALNYERLAREEPDVIGMLGYSWAGGLPEEPTQLGTRSLPLNVKAIHKAIGMKILSEK